MDIPGRAVWKPVGVPGAFARWLFSGARRRRMDDGIVGQTLRPVYFETRKVYEDISGAAEHHIYHAGSGSAHDNELCSQVSCNFFTGFAILCLWIHLWYEHGNISVGEATTGLTTGRVKTDGGSNSGGEANHEGNRY